MARTICGVCHRGGAGDAANPDPNRDAIGAMLAELPGLGRAGRINGGAVSFGYRALRADAGEQGQEDAWQARCSARGLIAVADARLDNRAELASALGLGAAESIGATDCGLILRAYGRWGENCPLQLHGDYAFAVWDPAKRLLFCARDALGARPFYYALAGGGRFVFASDIAAALAAPGVEDDLDEAHAVINLMGNTPDTNSTFFRAVRSLPPGHSIAANRRGEHLRRWWRPEDAPAAGRGSNQDYQRQFLDHYRRAVRDRLQGAGPVGAHLSGGLDSSSVAVLAARELRPSGRRLHALCWHPPPNDSQPENEASEYRLIESVCAQEGLHPRYHSVSVEHTLARLGLDGARVADHQGVLMHESLVQRSAAELDVRVILSGWGGDEIASSSGADYYPMLLRGGRWRQLLREARRRQRSWRFLACQAVLPLVHPRASNTVSALLKGQRPRMLRPSFVYPALARKHRRPPQGRLAARPVSVRQTQLVRLGSGHLEQRIQDWAASGARTGIEYRYPLLDRRLIEFVLGLPPEQFRYGRSSRWFFRQSLKSVLPPCVAEHTDKTDPARHRPCFDSLSEALPLIAGRLAARYDTPARARYLDMARLRAYLEAEAGLPDDRRQPGKILRALSFLDWQTD